MVDYGSPSYDEVIRAHDIAFIDKCIVKLVWIDMVGNLKFKFIHDYDDISEIFQEIG